MLIGKRVALMGFSGSGKTEVAKILADRHHYNPLSLAGPFKAGLLAMGVPHHAVYGTQAEKEEVLPIWGVSGRTLMKTIGTGWGRSMVREDLWADLLVSKIEGAPLRLVVVDDLRHINEARILRAAGFTIVAVERPGLTGELYELDQIVPDVILKNDGDLQDLRYAVGSLLARTA